MTVIAWDGRTLAADKQTTFGSVKAQTTKIKRSTCGALMGAAGPTAACREMMDWYERGAMKESFPQHQRDEQKSAALLVITKDKKVLHFDASPWPVVIENKQFAIGSGENFAMAAMYCGKDAAQAIAVASLFHVHCGNGIDYLHFELSDIEKYMQRTHDEFASNLAASESVDEPSVMAGPLKEA